jgi:hypothetical protein
MTFSRAVNGLLGNSVARLIPTGSPSGAGAGSSGTAQIKGEIFFYAHVVRGPGLDTIAGEVAELDAGDWRPSSVDFRAISIRSAGGRNPVPGAEISTAVEFLAILELPAARFNFFGYSTSDGLALQAEVRPNTVVGPDAGVTSRPDSPAFDSTTIAALRELGGLSSGGGALGERLRALRKRNKDFNDQHRGTRESPVLRELWLAMADTPPNAQFAADLAKALMMRIVIYPERIVFRPEFTVSPPQILKRGVIELQLNQTSDLHTFDPEGQAFDP